MTVILVRPQASGGLATHVDQELAELTAAGHDVREAPVHIQDRPHPIADLSTLRILRHCLRTAPTPTAVHAHGLRAGALAALAMPRGEGRRLVVTLHNRTVGSLLVHGIGRALLALIARRADTVLAVSPDLANDARRAGARDVRHAVVPAPGRTSASAASEQDAVAGRGATGSDLGVRSALELLVIARLATQKGLPDLLDAAALLRAGDPVRIRVAGDGPLHDELAARIREEELPVELLGRREDVPELLAACDLVVSAALWEGQPVALQEALRAGRAIVATDAGGTRWVTGDAARLVPVGDAPALAAAIADHRDPEVLQRAAAASRRRAQELPGTQDMIDQLADVLSLIQHR